VARCTVAVMILVVAMAMSCCGYPLMRLPNSVVDLMFGLVTMCLCVGLQEVMYTLIGCCFDVALDDWLRKRRSFLVVALMQRWTFRG